MNSAVEQAINCIWARYHEPLTLSDIARSAILSKFHFCRIFSRATGVSPGRYLSAVRIYQAKRFLATTSLKVTDISFSVGYNSLGSFTNHFTESVGLSPGKFRRMAQAGCGVPVQRIAADSMIGTVSGKIILPPGHSIASVYVGIFRSAIVECTPVAADIFPVVCGADPVTFSLRGVPVGEWFVHAVAVAESVDPEPWTRRVLLRSSQGPIRTGYHAEGLITVPLRCKAPTDLPVLFALPNLETALDNFVRPRERSLVSADLASGIQPYRRSMAGELPAIR